MPVIGTRIPLETVVDNLAAGHAIAEMLENYPALRMEHIKAVLQSEGTLAREAAGERQSRLPGQRLLAAPPRRRHLRGWVGAEFLSRYTHSARELF